MEARDVPDVPGVASVGQLEFGAGLDPPPVRHLAEYAHAGGAVSPLCYPGFSILPEGSADTWTFVPERVTCGVCAKRIAQWKSWQEIERR